MNSSFGTNSKYVTIAQAAEILNQSVKTVRRRISDAYPMQKEISKAL